MDKETEALCDELCALLGHKSWIKTGRRCTGDWTSTTDYSLQWEDGKQVFVTNGMRYFKERVAETVTTLKRVRSAEYQQAVMEVLLEWQTVDARLSREYGVNGYDILGMVECDGDSCGLIWFGLRLKVGDSIVNHIETGMCHDMTEGPDRIRSTMERTKNIPVWTAGAVREMDYIFHGVGFNSSDRLYKADDKGELRFYPWKRQASQNVS